MRYIKEYTEVFNRIYRYFSKNIQTHFKGCTFEHGGLPKNVRHLIKARNVQLSKWIEKCSSRINKKDFYG